jgi:hypothetical protein
LKKEDEKNALLKVLSIVHVNVECLQCREAPDFRFINEGRSIGAEITQFHIRKNEAKGKPRREVEEIWHTDLKEHITSTANQIQELKLKKGTLHFKALWLPNNKEKNDFINQIVLLAKRMAATKIQLVNDFSHYPLLDRYLNSLRLEETKSSINWKWNYDGIVFDPSEIEESLVESITNKAEKGYNHRNFDELWLVIYSLGAYLSQSLILNREIFHTYMELEECAQKSGFDRIIVADWAFDKAIQWPKWDIINK